MNGCMIFTFSQSILPFYGPDILQKWLVFLESSECIMDESQLGAAPKLHIFLIS